MKKALFFLMSITLMSVSSKQDTAASQQSNPFLGTWQHQEANNNFIVSIWQDNEGIVKGHYKMITVNSNGVQTGVVYNSKKEIGSSGYNWPHVLYAGQYDNNYIIGGNIIDNTVNNPRGFIEGQFSMKTTGVLCTSCPQTAVWKVKKDQGLREPGEPEFNVPTDITLTKVSSTINPD
jgi:hypothetical protein